MAKTIKEYHAAVQAYNAQWIATHHRDLFPKYQSAFYPLAADDWTVVELQHRDKAEALNKLREKDEPEYFYQRHLLNWDIDGQERKAKQIFDDLDSAYLIANCDTEDEYLQLKRENTNVLAFLTRNKLPVNRELFLTKADTCRNAIDEYTRTIEQMEQNNLKCDFEETLLSDFKNNKALIEVELAKRTNVAQTTYRRSRVIRKENVDTVELKVAEYIKMMHERILKKYMIVAVYKFHDIKRLSLKWGDNLAIGCHVKMAHLPTASQLEPQWDVDADGWVCGKYLTYNVALLTSFSNLNAFEPQQMIAY